MAFLYTWPTCEQGTHSILPPHCHICGKKFIPWIIKNIPTTQYNKTLKRHYNYITKQTVRDTTDLKRQLKIFSTPYLKAFIISSELKKVFSLHCKQTTSMSRRPDDQQIKYKNLMFGMEFHAFRVLLMATKMTFVYRFPTTYPGTSQNMDLCKFNEGNANLTKDHYFYHYISA